MRRSGEGVIRKFARRWRDGRRGADGNERKVWAYAAWLASLRFTFGHRSSPFSGKNCEVSPCILSFLFRFLATVGYPSLSFHPRGGIDVARLSNDCARTDNGDGACYMLVGRRETGGGRTNERTRVPNDVDDEDEDGDVDVGEHGSSRHEPESAAPLFPTSSANTHTQPPRVVNSDSSCRELVHVEVFDIVLNRGLYELVGGEGS